MLIISWLVLLNARLSIPALSLSRRATTAPPASITLTYREFHPTNEVRMNASIDLVACMDNRYVCRFRVTKEFVVSRSRKIGTQSCFVEDYLLNYKLIGIVLFGDIRKRGVLY